MPGERASKKQQELLQFVDDFIVTNGYGPSYREIMNGLGYKSVSTVAIHVENLIAKGYLARRDKSARSLEVVKSQSSVPQSQWQNDLEAHIRGLSLDEAELKQVSETLLTLGLDSIAKRLNVKDES